MRAPPLLECERLNHTAIMPNFGPRRLSFSARDNCGARWHPKLWNGVRQTDVRMMRTAPMFDPALLIASALGLALMVVFSELP